MRAGPRRMQILSRLHTMCVCVCVRIARNQRTKQVIYAPNGWGWNSDGSGGMWQTRLSAPTIVLAGLLSRHLRRTDPGGTEKQCPWMSPNVPECPWMSLKINRDLCLTVRTVQVVKVAKVTHGDTIWLQVAMEALPVIRIPPGGTGQSFVPPKMRTHRCRSASATQMKVWWTIAGFEAQMALPCKITSTFAGTDMWLWINTYTYHF